MSSTNLEIKVDRKSKTFLPGDYIKGSVIINTKTTLKFEGLDLHLDGLLSTQKNQLLADNFSTTSTNISKPHVIIGNLDLTSKPGKLKSLCEGSCVPLLPAGKLNVGVTKVPFSVELRPTAGVEMVETYHGVHILVSYLLKSVYSSIHSYSQHST